MQTYELIPFFQILAGAVILLVATFVSLKAGRETGEGFRNNWRIIIFLTIFFLSGYVLYLTLYLLNRPFLLNLLTGLIFFGGAVFVYIMIHFTRTSILDVLSKEKELKADTEQVIEGMESLREINKELEQEIAQRILIEQELRESEGKYAALVESTDDSIYLLDREFRYLYINKNHLLRLGIREQVYQGKKYSDFHTDEESKRFERIIAEVFRTGRSIQLEHNSRRDNNYFLLTLSPVKNSGTETTAVTVVSKKITELKKMEQELHTVTLTDTLTGLYNRRGFLTLAEQQLKMANRTNTVIYMLYADLDNLKTINDRYGHQEGDGVLREAARLFSETFRESDIISRIGGDEFVVMPIKGEEDVAGIAARLKKNLDSYNAEENRKYSLSLSVGITCYNPANPVSVEDLLSRCDKLMYNNKAGKKAC
jgi:diguanylate cyclase (GGDEF)-like protein/PAS domain S-box-containing protein